MRGKIPVFLLRWLVYICLVVSQLLHEAHSCLSLFWCRWKCFLMVLGCHRFSATESLWRLRTWLLSSSSPYYCQFLLFQNHRQHYVRNFPRSFGGNLTLILLCGCNVGLCLREGCCVKISRPQQEVCLRRLCPCPLREGAESRLTLNCHCSMPCFDFLLLY